jgi:hypothetical protein
MRPKTRPAPMHEPRSTPEAEAPKWQSADLYDLSVSPSGALSVVRLSYVHDDGNLGELVLCLDWRAAAAFLDFADRKRDVVDALQLGFLARPREFVSWSLTTTPDEFQRFRMEPRLIRFDLEQHRFAVNLFDPWRPEHRVWLFLSDVSLRAIVTELRAGLAQRRQARSY